ncbi:hypothetical protein ACRXCV_00520 (plasmid) [Halobacteriovorax sp. GFR7]|uniref:hypothetical protein n=1 Tax=unclassified Halobacteriovorax TaxID=2639665 RepID=UPI003D99BF4E
MSKLHHIDIEVPHTKLAISYYKHYDRVGGVLYDAMARKEKLLEEHTRADAVRHNNPMLGTLMEAHIIELKKVIKQRDSLRGMVNRVFRYFSHEQEMKRQEQEERHARNMLLIYEQLEKVYDWNWRSLNPVLAWSGSIQAYVLGCDNRPVYDPDLGADSLRHQAPWGYGSHCFAIQVITLNGVEDFTWHPEYGEELRAHTNKGIQYLLGKIEPQYHNEEAGYF